MKGHVGATLLLLLWASLALLVSLAVWLTPSSIRHVASYEAEEPLLPAIVVISSSPTTSVSDTLLAARAVVLNSFASEGGDTGDSRLSLERVILLDASGQLVAAESGVSTASS